MYTTGLRWVNRLYKIIPMVYKDVFKIHSVKDCCHRSPFCLEVHLHMSLKHTEGLNLNKSLYNRMSPTVNGSRWRILD